MKRIQLISIGVLLLLFGACQKKESKIERLQSNRVLVNTTIEDKDRILKGMRRNLKFVEKILEALSREDFKEVENIAGKMLLSEEKSARINSRENDQFNKLAIEFHGQGAMEVVRAAKTKNTAMTLQSLSSLINKCNVCHDQYRLVEWK
jgi:cytochrome c556